MAYRTVARSRVVNALVVSWFAVVFLSAIPYAENTFAAAPSPVDPVASAVNITFKQLNVPVQAKFKKFVGQIDYDPSKPLAGKANLEIDIASFDLGDPDYNKEVLKKEWFNATQFPKARFVSSSIKPEANGQLTVTGKLTIKGKTSDVRFPLSFKQEAGRRLFDGTLPIKRLTYGIGEGEWNDTSIVADEVLIKFHLVAL
jgi:polyisoprenoid-binding protein YceI